MKKKILYRALLGAPMGLAISYLITIAVSLGWGGGAYHPCMPGLVALAGSESGAVALQAAVACLVGAGFAGSSVVWAAELLAGRRSVRRLNARLAQRQSSAPER